MEKPRHPASEVLKDGWVNQPVPKQESGCEMMSVEDGGVRCAVQIHLIERCSPMAAGAFAIQQQNAASLSVNAASLIIVFSCVVIESV
jgi:hypothetical protein